MICENRLRSDEARVLILDYYGFSSSEIVRGCGLSLALYLSAMRRKRVYRDAFWATRGRLSFVDFLLRI